MDIGSWLVWGFAATLLLTSLMAGSQAVGWSRMNLPYMLGTMFTENRDRAKILGFLFHLANGWIFSLIYIATFQQLGEATWYWGAAIGFVHGTFVLVGLMPNLPAIHPHMADEQQPSITRARLEPPGYLGLNYGVETPISVMTAHIAFGILLGFFYRMPS